MQYSAVDGSGAHASPFPARGQVEVSGNTGQPCTQDMMPDRVMVVSSEPGIPSDHRNKDLWNTCLSHSNTK